MATAREQLADIVAFIDGPAGAGAPPPDGTAAAPRKLSPRDELRAIVADLSQPVVEPVAPPSDPPGTAVGRKAVLPVVAAVDHYANKFEAPFGVSDAALPSMKDGYNPYERPTVQGTKDHVQRVWGALQDEYRTNGLGSAVLSALFPSPKLMFPREVAPAVGKGIRESVPQSARQMAEHEEAKRIPNLLKDPAGAADAALSMWLKNLPLMGESSGLSRVPVVGNVLGWKAMADQEGAGYLQNSAKTTGIPEDFAREYAQAYGAVSGVIEHSQQLMFNKGTTKLLGRPVSALKSKLLPKFVAHPLAKVLLGRLYDTVAEGGEELSQGYLEHRIMTRMVQDWNAKTGANVKLPEWTSEKAWDAFKSGAAVGGVGNVIGAARDIYTHVAGAQAPGSPAAGVPPPVPGAAESPAGAAPSVAAAPGPIEEEEDFIPGLEPAAAAPTDGIRPDDPMRVLKDAIVEGAYLTPERDGTLLDEQAIVDLGRATDEAAIGTALKTFHERNPNVPYPRERLTAVRGEWDRWKASQPVGATPDPSPPPTAVPPTKPVVAPASPPPLPPAAAAAAVAEGPGGAGEAAVDAAFNAVVGGAAAGAPVPVATEPPAAQPLAPAPAPLVAKPAMPPSRTATREARKAMQTAAKGASRFLQGQKAETATGATVGGLYARIRKIGEDTGRGDKEVISEMLRLVQVLEEAGQTARAGGTGKAITTDADGYVTGAINQGAAYPPGFDGASAAAVRKFLNGEPVTGKNETDTVERAVTWALNQLGNLYGYDVETEQSLPVKDALLGVGDSVTVGGGVRRTITAMNPDGSVQFDGPMTLLSGEPGRPGTRIESGLVPADGVLRVDLNSYKVPALEKPAAAAPPAPAAPAAAAPAAAKPTKPAKPKKSAMPPSRSAKTKPAAAPRAPTATPTPSAPAAAPAAAPPAQRAAVAKPAGPAADPYMVMPMERVRADAELGVLAAKAALAAREPDGRGRKADVRPENAAMPKPAPKPAEDLGPGAENPADGVVSVKMKRGAVPPKAGIKMRTYRVTFKDGTVSEVDSTAPDLARLQAVEQRAKAAPGAATEDEIRNTEDRTQTPQAPAPKPLTTAEEDAAYEADKAALRKILLGRTSMGLDPEIAVIGSKIAAYHVKRGVRQFSQFAKAVRADMADLWDKIKAHLRTFWEAAAVDNPDLEEVSRSDADAAIRAAEAAESLPVPAPAAQAGGYPYYVDIRGVRRGFGSLKEISESWSNARDASGLGSNDLSEMTNGRPLVYDGAGNQIGHISYNGRIWKGTPDQDSDELLYDNRQPGAFPRTKAAPPPSPSSGTVNTEPQSAPAQPGKFIVPTAVTLGTGQPVPVPDAPGWTYIAHYQRAADRSIGHGVRVVMQSQRPDGGGTRTAAATGLDEPTAYAAARQELQALLDGVAVRPAPKPAAPRPAPAAPARSTKYPDGATPGMFDGRPGFLTDPELDEKKQFARITLEDVQVGKLPWLSAPDKVKGYAQTPWVGFTDWHSRQGIAGTVRMLPLSSLVVTKDEIKSFNRDEGDNVSIAAARMIDAAEGRGDKRAPVRVLSGDDGRYYVADGNATTLLAMAAEWTHIPCVVERGMPPSVPDTHPDAEFRRILEEAASGHAHWREHVADFSKAEAARNAADAGPDWMAKALVQAQGIVATAERAVPQFMRDLFGFAAGREIQVQFGPVKRADRMVAKASDPKRRARDKTVADIHDVLRATFVVGNADGAALLNLAKEAAAHYGVAESEIDDKFAHPTNAGYRDVSFKFQLGPDAVWTEIQFNSPEMMDAKSVAHLYYAVSRSLPQKKSERNEHQKKAFKVAEEMQKACYRGAFAAAARRAANSAPTDASRASNSARDSATSPGKSGTPEMPSASGPANISISPSGSTAQGEPSSSRPNLEPAGISDGFMVSPDGANIAPAPPQVNAKQPKKSGKKSAMPPPVSQKKPVQPDLFGTQPAPASAMPKPAPKEKKGPHQSALALARLAQDSAWKPVDAAALVKGLVVRHAATKKPLGYVRSVSGNLAVVSGFGKYQVGALETTGDNVVATAAIPGLRGPAEGVDSKRGGAPDEAGREPSGDVGVVAPDAGSGNPPADGGSAAPGGGGVGVLPGPGRPAGQPDAGQPGGLGSRDGGRGPDGVGGAAVGAADGSGTVQPAADVPGPVRGEPGADGGVDRGPGQQHALAHRNLRLTDADSGLEPSGDAAKADANIAAIELLKRLEAEGRLATPDEQRTLARYVGWGFFKEAFAIGREDNEGWRRKYGRFNRRLKELLTDEEWAEASKSTINAHYTEFPVASAMWRALARMGFTGGRIADFGAGKGTFFGLMPESMTESSRLYAVEGDGLTARILKQLFPSATVVGEYLEKVETPAGWADLVVGNVPFSDVGPFDPRHPKDNLNLHNFFIRRALETVRPGGIVAVITSNSTLDNNPREREILAREAHLLGAIRLPNTTFTRVANTEVTTDILFLRRPMAGQTPTESFTDTVEVAPGIEVNEYFARHPEMALGKHTLSGTMHGRPDQYALVSGKSFAKIVEAIDEAAQNLPQGVFSASDAAAEDVTPELAADQDVPDSQYHIVDGRVVQRQGQFDKEPKYELAFVNADGKERKRKPDATKLDEIARAYIAVRSAARALVNLEKSSDTEDIDLQLARQALNRAYDKYVKDHGTFNGRTTVSRKADFLRDDPDYYMVLGLENEAWEKVKDRSGTVTGTRQVWRKSDIFTKRAIPVRKQPDAAANTEEAVTASMGWRGEINLPMIARLLKTTPADAEKRLHASELTFLNPASGAWELRDRYLSGHVREKLKQARAAMAADSRLQKNVDALAAVQPPHVEFQHIHAAAGARFIPLNVSELGIKAVVGVEAEVRYKDKVDFHSVRLVTAPAPDKEALYSTDRVNVQDLIQNAINGQSFAIYDTISLGGGRTTRQFNPTATQAANDAMAKFKDAFVKWLGSTKEMVDYNGEKLGVQRAVEERYNDMMNGHVTPNPDGSYLALPGLSEVVRRSPYRMSAVARVLQYRSAVFAHGVGSGKTFTLIVAAMEGRRLGLWSKPMIVVQKATVGQFAASFVQAYPGARVLVADESTFDKHNRKRFFGQIASGAWDCIIVTHPQFIKIPANPATIAKYIREQIEELEKLIVEERAAAGNDKAMVKHLEKAKQALEARLQKQLQKAAAHQDKGMYFEDLGIDGLFIDEAHAYKKIPLITRKRRVKGIPTDASERAIDLDAKSRIIRAKPGGGALVMATGTPVTNSMAEAFVMLKIVNPALLDEFGVGTFDAWADTFGVVEQGFEYSWSGQFKYVDRFSKFVNGAELITMIRSVFDVRMGNKALGLNVPELTGGGPQVVTVDPSPAMGDMLDLISALASAWDNLAPRGKKDNGHVPILTMAVGAASALDPRLVDRNAADDPGSKVNQAVKDIVAGYKESADRNGVTLVFADRFAPMRLKSVIEFLKAHGDFLGKAWAERLEAGLSNADRRASGLPEITADDGSTDTDDLSDAVKDKIRKLGLDPDDPNAEAVMAEIEAFAGTGFNLYRDIRLKLIAAGIPAEQVAIIHEANTDKRRVALFEKVNRGEIRVLLGSTATLGVGVNVQERAAKLIHLDPPLQMTPAMMEQRNGRIIRQGNLHFDWKKPITVSQYGVKGSMDTGIYQMLERKGKFIVQLLTADGTSRTFDDPADESTVSMQQMVANLTGDTRPVRLLELTEQVRRLRDEQAAHDNQITARRREVFRTREDADWDEKNRLPAARTMAEAITASGKEPTVHVEIDEGTDVWKSANEWKEQVDLVDRLIKRMQKGLLDWIARGKGGDPDIIGFVRFGKLWVRIYGKLGSSYGGQLTFDATYVAGLSREGTAPGRSTYGGSFTTAAGLFHSLRKFTGDAVQQPAMIANRIASDRRKADEWEKVLDEMPPFAKTQEIEDLITERRRLQDDLINNPPKRVSKGRTWETGVMYVDAVEAELMGGRREKASRVSHRLDRAIRAIEAGDPAAIAKAAESMAAPVQKDDVLVPVPAHTGSRSYNLALAKAIAERTGARVADIVRRRPMPLSQSQIRERAIAERSQAPALTPNLMNLKLRGELGEARRVWMVDVAAESGASLRAVRDLLGQGRGLVYAKRDVPVGETAFAAGSRGTATADGVRAEMGDRAVKTLVSRGISIVDGLPDVPGADRDVIAAAGLAQGVDAAGARGVFMPDGRVYLFAGNHDDAAGVWRTLEHETFERGLNAIGQAEPEALAALLDDIYKGRIDKAADYRRARALVLDRYKYDAATPEGRRAIARETLAHIAETRNTRRDLWRRALAAVRRFLAKLFDGTPLAGIFGEAPDAVIEKVISVGVQAGRDFNAKGATVAKAAGAVRRAMPEPVGAQRAGGMQPAAAAFAAKRAQAFRGDVEGARAAIAKESFDAMYDLTETGEAEDIVRRFGFRSLAEYRAAERAQASAVRNRPASGIRFAAGPAPAGEDADALPQDRIIRKLVAELQAAEKRFAEAVRMARQEERTAAQAEIDRLNAKIEAVRARGRDKVKEALEKAKEAVKPWKLQALKRSVGHWSFRADTAADRKDDTRRRRAQWLAAKLEHLETLQENAEATPDGNARRRALKTELKDLLGVDYAAALSYADGNPEILLDGLIAGLTADSKHVYSSVLAEEITRRTAVQKEIHPSLREVFDDAWGRIPNTGAIAALRSTYEGLRAKAHSNKIGTIELTIQENEDLKRRMKSTREALRAKLEDAVSDWRAMADLTDRLEAVAYQDRQMKSTIQRTRRGAQRGDADTIAEEIRSGAPESKSMQAGQGPAVRAESVGGKYRALFATPMNMVRGWVKGRKDAEAVQTLVTDVVAGADRAAQAAHAVKTDLRRFMAGQGWKTPDLIHLHKELVEVDTPDGGTMEFTRAELVSLMASSMMPENRAEMDKQGATFRPKRYAQQTGVGAVMPQAGMGAAWARRVTGAHLTAREKALAAELFRRMSDDRITRAINTASVAQEGFEKAIYRGSYWPLKRDFDRALGDMSDLSAAMYREASSQNLGMFKRRTKNNLPLLFGDALDIFEEHVTDAFNYAHLSAPTSHALRVLGTAREERAPDGRPLPPDPAQSKVRALIEARHGKEAVAKLKDFYLRLSGLKRSTEQGTFARAIQWVVNNISKATLAYRLTSFARNRLGAIPFATGLAEEGDVAGAAKMIGKAVVPVLPKTYWLSKTAQADREFLLGHAYLSSRWDEDNLVRVFLQARTATGRWQGPTADQRKLAAQVAKRRFDEAIEWGLSWMSDAEQINAVQLFRHLVGRGLSREAARDKVAEMTRATQNPSGVAEESAAYIEIRDNPIVRAFLPFMGQPTVVANWIMDAALDVQAAKATGQGVSEARRKLSVRMAGATLTAVSSSVVGLAWMALRARNEPPDDDDKEQLMRGVQDTARELLDYFIPGAGRVMDQLPYKLAMKDGALAVAKDYEQMRRPSSLIARQAVRLAELGKSIEARIEGDEDKAAAYFQRFAQAMGALVGVPVESVSGMVDAVRGKRSTALPPPRRSGRPMDPTGIRRDISNLKAGIRRSAMPLSRSELLGES